MKKINVEKLANWKPFAFLPYLLEALQARRYGWSSKEPNKNGMYLLLDRSPDSHALDYALEVEVELIGNVKLKKDIVYVTGDIGGMKGRRCDSDFLKGALKRCYWKRILPASDFP